jgi:putative NADH-flavin reductase
MLEAMESSEVASRISGKLSVTAKVTGYLSLIPLLGTVAGIESLALDHGAQIANHVKFKKDWWTLAPEISETLSKVRVEQRLKELGS